MRALVIIPLMLLYVSAAHGQEVTASREALAARVQSVLKTSHVANVDQIKVNAKGDAVQLSGFVESEADQEKALEAVRSVKGVGSVRNDLVVRESRATVGQALDDTIIAARVRKQIASDISDGGSNIDVVVNDGLVQLSGYVADAGVKAYAADVASAVQGVRDVRNDIALRH